jgi:hypothetical protein
VQFYVQKGLVFIAPTSTAASELGAFFHLSPMAVEVRAGHGRIFLNRFLAARCTMWQPTTWLLPPSACFGLGRFAGAEVNAQRAEVCRTGLLRRAAEYILSPSYLEVFKTR